MSDRFDVITSPEAQRNITTAYRYIQREAPGNALRWKAGLRAAIESLDLMPTRCGVAPEAEHLNRPLRQMIYHSHRIIFLIDAPRNVVRVLYVRHAARRAIGEDPGGE